jgi:sugar lactone lactonase YvrE
MEGKSPVAVGMSFGPDGNLYVSDMLGGQILKYGNRGGGLLGSTRPLTGGFNNVKGITVGSDGSIYAAEIGNERIYRFNGDLTFNRVYEMGCKPLFMALSSEREWMEVSCETKLVSLNIETGLVQNVHVENAAQLQHPNGITYGPDGTLYVLENNGVVIAYTVKH